MVLEIAAGIVLAVLILAFIRQLIALAIVIAMLLLVFGIVVIAGIAAFDSRSSQQTQVIGLLVLGALIAGFGSWIHEMATKPALATKIAPEQPPSVAPSETPKYFIPIAGSPKLQDAKAIQICSIVLLPISVIGLAVSIYFYPLHIILIWGLCSTLLISLWLWANARVRLLKQIGTDGGVELASVPPPTREPDNLADIEPRIPQSELDR